MNRLNRKLVKIVATLLCQEDVTHPAFFWELTEVMRSRGWELQAHQRGIHGTYLHLVKLGEDNVEVSSTGQSEEVTAIKQRGA